MTISHHPKPRRNALPLRAISQLRRFGGEIFLLIIVLTAYGMTLTHTYGFREDFVIERFSTTAPFDWIENRFHREGRFLSGVAILGLYQLMPATKYFVLGRLVSQLGLLCLGVLIARSLRSGRYPCPIAYATAALVLLAPPMALYAGWTITFPYPWAGVCALAAGLLWIKIPERKTQSQRALFAGLSAVLLLSSLHLYQCFFGIFFLPMAAHAIRMPKGRAFWGRWLAAGLFVGFICFIYLGTLEAAKAWLFQPHFELNRVNFTTDFIARLDYMRRSVALVLPSWSHWAPPIVQFATIGLLLGGVLVTVISKQWQNVLGNMFVVATLGLLANLPLYLSTEHAVNFRSVPLLYLCLIWCLGSGLTRLIEHRAQWRSGALAFSAFTVLVSLWAAHTVLWQGIVKISTKDYAYFSSWVSENLESHANVVFYRPVHYSNLAYHDIKWISEFGYSFAGWPYIPWGPLPQILWERFGDPSASYAEQLKRQSALCVPIRSTQLDDAFLPFPLIDGPELLPEIDAGSEFSPAIVEAPVLGAVEHVYTNYIYSREVGLVFVIDAKIDPASGTVTTPPNEPELHLWSHHLAHFFVRRGPEGKLLIRLQGNPEPFVLESAKNNQWVLSGPRGLERWDFEQNSTITKEIIPAEDSFEQSLSNSGSPASSREKRAADMRRDRDQFEINA